MYPEQDPVQQPIPVVPSNYLDQIAPTYKKPGLLDNKPVVIGGIVLILILLVSIFSMISSVSANQTKPVKLLAVRLINIRNISEDATGKIKSTKLRETNSTLRLYMTNTIREATPALMKYDINMEKIDKQVLALESSSKVLETLEDARLNAIYDRTYAREMSYQLEKLLSVMNEVNAKFKNAKFRQFYDNSFADLQTSQQQFESFNSN